METKNSNTTSVISGLVTSVSVLLVHFISLVLTMVVLCRVVPTFYELFVNWDVLLPVVSQQVIRMSEFCIQSWIPIVLFSMVVDTTLVFFLAFGGSRKRWLLSIYSHLYLFGVIILMFWIIVGLGVPIIGLIHQEGLPE